MNDTEPTNDKTCGALRYAAILCLVALGVALIVDHWNHVVSALPYLLLLACPLTHLFMHKGHCHHGDKK